MRQAGPSAALRAQSVTRNLPTRTHFWRVQADDRFTAERTQRFTKKLQDASDEVRRRKGLGREEVVAAVEALSNPPKPAADDVPDTREMLESMRATLEFLAANQTASMKKNPRAMRIAEALLRLRPAYANFFHAILQSGRPPRDADWSAVCKNITDRNAVYALSTRMSDQQLRAARDAEPGVFEADERLVIRQWTLHRTVGAWSWSLYVGETDQPDGHTRRIQHRDGLKQLCDRLRRKLEQRYGATTAELELWDRDEILALANELGVPYIEIRHTAECVAFVLASAGTSTGGTNVGVTGLVIGMTTKRISLRLRSMAASLTAALPELTLGDAIEVVYAEVPLSCFTDDPGVMHAAALRGMGCGDKAGVLERVLESEGGKLPSSSPPSFFLCPSGIGASVRSLAKRRGCSRQMHTLRPRGRC